MEERIQKPWTKLTSYEGEYSASNYVNKRNVMLTELWKKMGASGMKFESFFDYLLRRHEWMKSGSAMGARGEFNIGGYGSDLEKLRLTKR